jgi:hypothetical protein
MTTSQTKKQLQKLVTTPAANNLQLFHLVGKVACITVCIISN